MKTFFLSVLCLMAAACAGAQKIAKEQAGACVTLQGHAVMISNNADYQSTPGFVKIKLPDGELIVPASRCEMVEADAAQ